MHARAALLTLSLSPFLFGFGACSALLAGEDAPSMEGDWLVTYDDALQVEITLGGATYTAEVGVEGGTVDIEHEGQPLSFDLNCAQEAVVCPSEAWPAQVTLEQREPEHPHRMWMPLERHVCPSEEMEPSEETCGEGTPNPDCSPVCEEGLVVEEVDTFGLISEDNTEFALLLGGGVATNEVNCALLGVSVAHGDLSTSGSAEQGDWTVDGIRNGEVVTGYSGGCLWADDVDGDEQLEALVLGATLTFRTGFVAERG